MFADRYLWRRGGRRKSPITNDQRATVVEPVAPRIKGIAVCEPPKPPEPSEPSVPADAPPIPPEEQDTYEDTVAHDEMALRRNLSSDAEVADQEAKVAAKDLLVLLDLFSKRGELSPQQIAASRRAMRNISGSEVERSIFDELSGRDGRVAALVDAYIENEATAPANKNDKTPTDFRWSDFV